MKRTISLLAPLFLAFAPVANADSPPVTSEVRAVSAFRAIDLAGTLEAEVTIGKPARVEIRAEPDLLDKVTTTVKDGVLVLDTKPSLRSSRHMRAIVTVPDLGAITISGTGDMKVSGIANDRLTLSVSGTGALTAAGSTGTLHVIVDGTGEISAKQLTAKDTT